MKAPILGQYDGETAAMLLGGAAAAYGNEGAIEAWAARQGCTGCEVIRDGAMDTLVFVAAADEFAVVSFRGTTDLRNWITDLECKLQSAECRMGNADLSGVKVHEGFQTALGRVWARILRIVERMEGRKRIYFTGHSLGGALAMLAMAWWSYGGLSGGTPDRAGGTPALPETWLYTFGQPRVGNGAWMQWFDARLKGRSFRVVHSADIVARVPWLLRMFRHAGTEIFYDAAGGMHVEMPWYRKLASDALGLWREWQRGRVALLADHHVESYVKLVSAHSADATQRDYV